MRASAGLSVSLVVIWGLAGCSSSGESEPQDLFDMAVQDIEQQEEPRGVSCDGLNEDECKASGACIVIEGWPIPEACQVWRDEPPVVQPDFAACRNAGKLACSVQFGWAHPADRAEEAWLFSNLCFPDGWVEVEGDPCSTVCPAPECTVGEIKCHNAAELHCEDACSDRPDCPRCGRWSDPEHAYTCETEAWCYEELGHCACKHLAQCEWCCQSDYHVCDNEGHCCLPDCSGKECGDDGCGGTCGLCDDGLECLNTTLGTQCTTQCELFSCPEGEFCLFGLCVNQQCTSDDDCGGAPAHHCDEFLQCRDREACQSTDECNTWNEDGYCDKDTGYCMYDGHCWDDADCSAGTCAPDHWCQGHNCYELYGPGCPPQLPICYMPSGELPLCDGMPCASCMVPCIFDADCPIDMVCENGGNCVLPATDCVLDAECTEGQYCHPGCADLMPACESESDCGEGELCLAGFCVTDQVIQCDDDAVCLAWAEGYTCHEGVCKPEGACVLDSQCEEGQYCHGTCLPIPGLPECKSDTGCIEGQICESEQCQVPPECYYDVQCASGHVCVDEHCYNDTGVCAWLIKGPGFCDDEDPCTTDSCNPETGCVHAPGTCD